MFIRKIIHEGYRPYYVVARTYRDQETGQPKYEYIVSLGHTRSIHKAHIEAWNNYLSAASKLERIERAIEGMGGA